MFGWCKDKNNIWVVKASFKSEKKIPACCHWAFLFFLRKFSRIFHQLWGCYAQTEFVSCMGYISSHNPLLLLCHNRQCRPIKDGKVNQWPLGWLKPGLRVSESQTGCSAGSWKSSEAKGRLSAERGNSSMGSWREESGESAQCLAGIKKTNVVVGNRRLLNGPHQRWKFVVLQVWQKVKCKSKRLMNRQQHRQSANKAGATTLVWPVWQQKTLSHFLFY